MGRGEWWCGRCRNHKLCSGNRDTPSIPRGQSSHSLDTVTTNWNKCWESSSVLTERFILLFCIRQEALGDVVFAELPEAGVTVKKGEECGALESVKAASELFSPVSGTVLEKNVEVEGKPGLINTSCYDEGWLFKVKLSQPDEVDSLMTEDKYNEYLKSH